MESESGVGNFGKAGVGNFGKVGVGVGYFTSDSATVLQTVLELASSKKLATFTWYGSKRHH